jgi:hypothetical protein
LKNQRKDLDEKRSTKAILFALSFSAAFNLFLIKKMEETEKDHIKETDRLQRSNSILYRDLRECEGK